MNTIVITIIQIIAKIFRFILKNLLSFAQVPGANPNFIICGLPQNDCPKGPAGYSASPIGKYHCP